MPTLLARLLDEVAGSLDKVAGLPVLVACLSNGLDMFKYEPEQNVLRRGKIDRARGKRDRAP